MLLFKALLSNSPGEFFIFPTTPWKYHPGLPGKVIFNPDWQANKNEPDSRIYQVEFKPTGE